MRSIGGEIMSKFVLKTPNIQVNVSRFAHIHYFELSKQYRTQEDSHSFRELIFVDSGSLEIHSDSYSGTLSQNDLIIHYPDEKHYLYTGDSTPNIIIVGFECNCERLDRFALRPYTVTPEMRTLLATMLSEAKKVFLSTFDIPNLKNMYKTGNYEFGADQLSKVWMEAFLIMLIRKNHKQRNIEYVNPTISHPVILEICGYLENNLAKRISVHEICALYGFNKTTFSRLFKEHTGHTYVDYIMTMKIAKAKQYLREGQMNITQISEALNFSSVNYFSKIFKDHVKRSPREYAQSIKANFS